MIVEYASRNTEPVAERLERLHSDYSEGAMTDCWASGMVTKGARKILNAVLLPHVLSFSSGSLCHKRGPFVEIFLTFHSM
jgi:hypothetical protein